MFNLIKNIKILSVVNGKREQYQDFTNNIAEAKEIIADGIDPEMVEMAKMEMDEAKVEFLN